MYPVYPIHPEDGKDHPRRDSASVRPHVHGTSDSEDDLPLSELKKRKVETEEDEEERRPHLDCFDSPDSDNEEGRNEKEPTVPTVAERRDLQMSLTAQFPVAPPPRVDISNHTVIGDDLSARALAYVII